MSESVAFHPLRDRRLPSRVLVALAVAVLIATAFAVILLVAAVRDGGSNPNPAPAAGVQPPAGPDVVVEDTCRPSRVVTAC